MIVQLPRRFPHARTTRSPVIELQTPHTSGRILLVRTKGTDPGSLGYRSRRRRHASRHSAADGPCAWLAEEPDCIDRTPRRIDEFSARRVRTAPAARLTLSNLPPYTLCIAISGEITLGNTTLVGDSACLVPHPPHAARWSTPALEKVSAVRTGSMSANPDAEDAPRTAPRSDAASCAPRSFVVLYFAILVYPILRADRLTVAGPDATRSSVFVIIVGPILGRIVYERHPTSVTRALAAVALTWLGICFQLFALMLPFELINAVVTLPSQPAGIAIAVIIVTLSVVGFVNTQILHVKRVRVPGPTSVTGRTLVQISDVHIGSRSPRLLNRIVERVNSLNADYVLITGDLIDFAGISRTELAPLHLQRAGDLCNRQSRTLCRSGQ
jgi:hypothetical protein